MEAKTTGFDSLNPGRGLEQGRRSTVIVFSDLDVGDGLDPAMMYTTSPAQRLSDFWRGRRKCPTSSTL
jgi:hypothetical protein